MFGNTLRKLKIIEAAVVAESGKYVDKFEALGIAAIDLDEETKASAGHTPELKKLKCLAADLNEVLNEGYIEQQNKLAAILGNITECLALLNQTADTGKLASGSNGVTSSDSSVDITKPMEVLLKHQLHYAYDQIHEIVDFKTSTLQLLHRVLNGYVKSVVAIGDESGVLYTAKKVEIVTSPYFQPLRQNRFFTTHEEEELLVSVRRMWAKVVLKSEDRTLLAERQLSAKHYGRHTQGTNSDWQYHIKLGCGAVLLLWAASECINNEIAERDVWNDQTFLIFLCLGDLLLLLLMWGVSMQVWRRSGIDFIKLLELENTELAGETHPEKAVYASVANVCILFLLAFVLFNKAVRGGYFGHGNDLTIAHAIPASLVVFCAVRMFFPCQTRKLWLHMLWRVLAAPFYKVNFCDGYIGDLLTSLVKVFIPMCFSVIYVAETVYAWLSNDMSITTEQSGRWWTGSLYYKFGLLPVLTLFPLWLRLLQCLRRSVDTGKRWPHIGNALKYTSAIIVISFGTFQPAVRHNPVWVAAFVFATLFQFAWDLTQDWGMVLITPPRIGAPISTSSGIPAVDCLVNTSFSFRKTRLVGSLASYLAVIFFNLTLRFAWTLTLLPAPEDTEGTRTLYVSFMTHLGPVLASAEILRRMVWGFYRLEWEQLEVIAKSKTEEVLHAEDHMNFSTLDKMDVASSTEMQPMSTYLGSGTVNSDSPWTEADWFVWLPPYVSQGIETSTTLRSFGTYEAKARFVEALIFAAVVVFIVAQAALPAYA